MHFYPTVNNRIANTLLATLGIPTSNIEVEDKYGYTYKVTITADTVDLRLFVRSTEVIHAFHQNGETGVRGYGSDPHLSERMMGVVDDIRTIR